MTQTATIYLRVSTAGQVEDGVSLAAQRAKAEAWTLANGYDVEGVYVDAGISGKRASNRDGLQTALNAVCHVRGALVVYTPSPASRAARATP